MIFLPVDESIEPIKKGIVDAHPTYGSIEVRGAGRLVIQALQRTAWVSEMLSPPASGVLALTAISPFRPRRWRGALLPREARVRFDVLDPEKRPVSASPDARENRDVVSVEIQEDREIEMRLLFDPERNLEERILNEQFRP